MELCESDIGGYYWQNGGLVSQVYLNKRLANEDKLNDSILWYLDGEECEDE